MEKHPDSEIITRLGGTAAVARMCRVRSPSVSEWKRSGIPDARRQFLELLHPDAFGLDSTEARRSTAAADATAEAAPAVPVSEAA